MISLKGLSYRFAGNQAYALRDINLDIPAGDFVVIAGPSGCGKSTLALALGGYLFQQFDGQVEGEITVAGKDVRQTPVYEIAETVGLVQQNPEAQFCTLTVEDEIAFGLENRCLPRDEIQERLSWSLDVVGGKHLLGRELATLSGGEKQKAAIAAMLATRPQVLIFDEPTSNLDPTATDEIFKVIAALRAKTNITVIVIEHKLRYLATFKPRLIEMADGRMVNERRIDSSHQLWPAFAPRLLRPVANHKPPLVSVQDLHAGYNGWPALQGVSLDIHPGEFVAVMGDNGCGKTTFLHCLMGLQKPTRGQVQVFGQDTRQTPIHEQARRVGLIFQNPEHQLFAGSVWQEAAFAASNFGCLDQAICDEIERLLSDCGLYERKEAHPYRLSYGEKRRLNLVSILSYHPTLILLDEMLIGQDPQNAAFLLELLHQQVQRGGAVVLVNHNPEATQAYANRLLFFESGRVLVDAAVEAGFQQLADLGKDSYLPDSFSPQPGSAS